MATRAEQKKRHRDERLRQAEDRERADRARALRLRLFAALGAAVVVLAVVFALNNSGGGSGSKATKGGQYKFAVGSPGPGQPAPPIRLPSTGGGTYDLAAHRGQTVLLYFQEGLTCQPCWDQIKDLERQMPKVKALGIGQVVTITSDPLDQLRQKAQDEGLTTPVLADPNLGVSKTYDANSYGMMGNSRDGHTFIVVGPDGRIRQRADYGGPPDFTMYVPVASLLADIRAGMQGKAA
jgi:peroxiredoxin Q/BCP